MLFYPIIKHKMGGKTPHMYNLPADSSTTAKITTPQSHQNLLLESRDGNGQVSSSSSESSFRASIKADFNRLKANRLHNYSLFLSAGVWSPSLVSLHRGVCLLKLLAYLKPSSLSPLPFCHLRPKPGVLQSLKARCN